MSTRGASLYEVISVLGIIALIFIPVYMWYSGSYTAQELSTSASSFVETVKLAQLYSQSIKNESKWGIRNNYPGDTKTYELVSRPLAGGVVTVEKSYTFPSSVEFTGNVAIWFTEGMSTLPETYVITLKDSRSSRMEITIYPTGVIETKRL
ncbi:hypothetical protein HY408_02190 [Candidatus Gottesmanbacteria bacterium]|nr:hypothetical protein [Candidatus Gottesmanbacteria bacterium]